MIGYKCAPWGLLILGAMLAAPGALARDGADGGDGSYAADPCDAGLSMVCVGTGQKDPEGTEIQHCECLAPDASMTGLSTNTDTSAVPPEKTPERTHNGPQGTLNQVTAHDSALFQQNSGARNLTSSSTLGAAEGLVQIKMGENAPAGVLLSQAEDQMDDAVRLRETADKTLLARDAMSSKKVTTPPRKLDQSKSALESSVGDEIFSEFESKYPMTRDDFARRYLSSRGNLAEMEKDLKLTPGAIEKAKEAGRALTGEEKVEILKNAKVGALRDRLKKRLDAAGSAIVARPETKTAAKAPHVAAPAAAPKKADEFQNLTAEPGLFGAPGDQGEATLFDVVHRKYREKARFFQR